MIITPERLREIYAKLRQRQAAAALPVVIEDDRPARSPALRRRQQEHGLQFPLPSGPLPVVLLDDVMHTKDYPVCDDPACCCYAYEREAIIAETTPAKRRRRKILVERNYEEERRRGTAQLNGTPGFSLLK